MVLAPALGFPKNPTAAAEAEKLLVTVIVSCLGENFAIYKVAKECEYEMVVNTGPSRGPTYKLLVIIEAIGGENINTTNVAKKWGKYGTFIHLFLTQLCR